MIDFSTKSNNEIKDILNNLNLENPTASHLLDMGCGRGRIAHYMATMTGGQVSGYNIDPNQIENAEITNGNPKTASPVA